jgi:predicted aldo/keto reductase-like oxidoreductase
MQYRNFPGLDWQPSALGFGCMRLPTTDGEQRSIHVDEQETSRMIRHAIDNGVNYLDTAYPYHGGMSEKAVGKALLGGYRDRVKLATKLPLGMVRGADDYDRFLNEQLARLQTDHLDFYLFHGLNRARLHDTVLKYGLLARAEAARRDGRIRHIGFSFHGEGDEFIEVIDAYDQWEFCQIQYNYMDIENQAGTKGLKYAAAKGLGVVVMEPLLGGRLATPPDDVQAVFAGTGSKRSPADWALQWLWDQPEVSLVLSGMSTMEQVVQNLAAADSSGPGLLSAADLQVFDLVREKFKSRAVIPCTSCNYCMPCPNGVDIPRVFKMYNEGIIYGQMDSSRFAYNVFFPEKSRADQCIQCRICEEKCPQSIMISEWMPKAHEALRKR